MRAKPRITRREGFTLAAVLVVMAAMLLMAVGVLAVIGMERKTARSYVDAKRAEWVARAGMEDVRGILREQSANDDYLIVAHKGEERIQGKEPLDLLYLARGKGGGDNVSYQLYPLFSSDEGSRTLSEFDDEFEKLELVGDDPAKVQIRERNDEAWVDWIPVIDDEDRMVGRYAFWVEDLQGKLNGQTELGDPGDDRERVEWPFPAPGVREDPDVFAPELALHALDPKIVGNEDTSDIDKRLEEGQSLMISPDSVLAAMEFEAPLERDEISGRLVEEDARSLEENVVPMVMSYEERPTVPFAKGISADAAGEPKLNLNAMLNAGREESIDRWAGWVNQAMPNFVDRKGGFPDDYLKTLAANVFDYADSDGDSSSELGIYRGLDSYPVVSEYAMRYRWEDSRYIDDVRHFILTGSVYVELWNMSDQVAEGAVEVSYDSAYVTNLGLMSGVELGSAEVLEDPSVMTPLLKRENGAYWLPPVILDPPLQPNEYRMIKAGTVEYRYPFFVLSPIVLKERPRGTLGYRMRWNGVEVDGSRSQVVRRDMTLNYPTQAKPEKLDRLRQRIENCVPGHSYSVDPNATQYSYVNNMGDPRMSVYLGESLDASKPNKSMSPNKYGNYSPHRRTIRWSAVYSSDSSTKPKVYGRVLPSEWPDGGHNSAFGRVPAAIKRDYDNNDEGDERIDPDDPQWLIGLVAPKREGAPMRVSNRGVFYSVCEMGRVYDPVMWEPMYESRTDTARILGGLMPSGQSSWPSVAVETVESPDHGGGNSLRIGRVEHPKFEVPDEDDDLESGQHAAHLLDLFHVGIPKSTDKSEREGELAFVAGNVNLNTATETAIRALVIGNLEQDPDLSRQVSKSHSTNDLMAPRTTNIELGAPVRDRAGDVIAEAIIRDRPFASAAELASIEDEDGEKIFGNREMYSYRDKIEWSDSAAEELYARIYESSTLRSRNFRVWVVGQAIVPLAQGSSAEPVIMAESRKVFNLFADPGDRTKDGAIDEIKYAPTVIHENDF